MKQFEFINKEKCAKDSDVFWTQKSNEEIKDYFTFGSSETNKSRQETNHGHELNEQKTNLFDDKKDAKKMFNLKPMEKPKRLFGSKEIEEPKSFFAPKTNKNEKPVQSRKEKSASSNRLGLKDAMEQTTRKEKNTKTPSVVVIDGPGSGYVEAGIAAAIGAAVSVVGFYLLTKRDEEKKDKTIFKK